MTAKASKGAGNSKIRDRRIGFRAVKTDNVIINIAVAKNISPVRLESEEKIIIL